MRSNWLAPVTYTVLVLAACALVAAAFARPASALMMAEAKDTRRAVLKLVPVGSTPEVAKAAMEQQGFSCTPMLNQPFTITDPDAGKPVPHAATDHLWCDSGKRGLLITKRWQVMFVEKAGAVSSVLVSTDLDMF